MKLTESTDTCTSDRVACTTKVNIKETFMENEGFCKCLCGEWTLVRKQKTYYLANLVFSEETLGHMVRNVKKFYNPS